MKAISRVEAGLCSDRFFCALDFSIHTLHSYLFVYEDQVFVYLGQYSFLSISLLIILFPPPPPSLFTVGCIIYSITQSKGRKEVLHTKNEGWVVGLFHILHRNCLLKYATEGKKGGMGRRGRRREHLSDDLKEARRYWKLKEEALDRTVWRTSFGRGYKPVDDGLDS